MDGGSQSGWSAGEADDREGDEHDGGEPDEDGEPWLGWTLSGTHGDDRDYEEDDSDLEDDDPAEEAEPSGIGDLQRAR